MTNNFNHAILEDVKSMCDYLTGTLNLISTWQKIELDEKENIIRQRILNETNKIIKDKFYSENIDFSKSQRKIEEYLWHNNKEEKIDGIVSLVTTSVNNPLKLEDLIKHIENIENDKN